MKKTYLRLMLLPGLKEHYVTASEMVLLMVGITSFIPHFII